MQILLSFSMILFLVLIANAGNTSSRGMRRTPDNILLHNKLPDIRLPVQMLLDHGIPDHISKCKDWIATEDFEADPEEHYKLIKII